MPASVPLERFVGPAIHDHGRGEVGIHDGSFEKGLAVPVHVHDVTVVSLMLSGVANERIAEGTRIIGAQDLIFTPAYAPHSYDFRESGRWLNIQISDSWLARATDGNRVLYERSEIVKSPAAAAWAMRIRNEVRRPDSVSKIAIDGAMTLMVAEMARVRIDAESTRPRWLRRVEEAVEASIAAPPDVETLAGIAGVNATHLLRTFKRYHGQTISTFVRERRVQLARTLLSNSQRPISMIALEAGFADQAHLTRVFKQTFGETPGQFARSVRGR